MTLQTLMNAEDTFLYLEWQGNHCPIKHKQSQFVPLDNQAVFIFNDNLQDYGRNGAMTPGKIRWHIANREFNAEMSVKLLAGGRLHDVKIEHKKVLGCSAVVLVPKGETNGKTGNS